MKSATWPSLIENSNLSKRVESDRILGLADKNERVEIIKVAKCPYHSIEYFLMTSYRQF